MKKFTQEVAEKNSKILNKIRQLREEKRYSREEMAEKLGMDTSTYTRIENGNVHLKMTTFIMIVMVLGVSMIELFYFTRTRDEATNEAKTPNITIVAKTITIFSAVIATG